MSMGNSSSLPASMSNINTIFVNGEKNAKFLAGPTRSRPGPILLRQAKTAVKLVVKPNSSKLTSNVEPKRITM